MKKKYCKSIAALVMFVSTVSLSLHAETKVETQVEKYVSNFYNISNWLEVDECWSDDQIDRNGAGDFVSGSINPKNKSVEAMWTACYKTIGRTNSVQKSLASLPAGTIPAEKMKQLLGECCFVRACMYSRLVFHFGDVPYSNTMTDVPTAMNRISKTEVLKHVYEDFDKAIESLPVSNPDGSVRATLGAALGMKARTALWFKDWDTVILCTRRIVNELKCYELYDDYYTLFLNKTHNTKESVFSLNRSIAAKKTLDKWNDLLPRNNGGYARYVPSWDLLAAYLCTDGLPIDESPLFDSHNPFENRDPRCTATIVVFDSYFMGFEYDPNPKTGREVLNTKIGEEVKNQDNLFATGSASCNGLLWKKRVDEDCLANDFKTEHDMWVMRYADILLMYAEAKIEKNEIDKSVLDAMNRVRARAYKCSAGETDKYPSIIETDQAKLRSILRFERRMEFPMENLRYYDLIRWQICEKAFGEANYGLYKGYSSTISNMVETGYWFWGQAPEVDENGIADFSKLSKKKMCNVLSERHFNSRQYLWPIPAKELVGNPDIQQNSGY